MTGTSRKGSRLRSAAIVAVAALALSAGSRSRAWTLTVDGHARTYRLYAPAGLPGGRAIALVLVFHGGEGDGASAERLTKFDELADREGFVVAYPDGLGKHWNDGRAVEGFETYRDRVDDVVFVSRLIDDVSAKIRVDPDRIFATGISNGAIFSNYLGARLADRIAAIAPVAGGLAEPFRLEFLPSRPVSALIINGTDDPLVPYAGGAVARTNGRVLGARETARLWAQADSCRPEAVSDPPSREKGGCRTVRERWTGGTGRTEVALDTIEGGGHTWPGGPQYAPKILIGRACPEPDATRRIWEFFRSHPKAPA